MVTARTGAAVAAITFSIMAGTMTTASAQSVPAPGGMTEEEYQQTIQQKQQEMIEQQRQQILRLMQEQQAALEKLRQQQEQERIRQQQQALMDKLQQQLGDERNDAEKKQQETTRGKLKQLLATGVLQKGGTSGSNANGLGKVSREQFAGIVGGALGLNPSQQSGASGNPTPNWFEDYIEAISHPFVPTAQPDPQQLALLMLQGINGAPNGKPDKSPGDALQKFLEEALENGLLQKTKHDEKKLRDDLIAAAYQAGGSGDPGGGGTDIWADYPFYAAGSNTIDINSLGAFSAVYDGIVRGEAGNGLPLAGTSHIDVDFSSGEASLGGIFDFDSGDTVELGGFYSASSLGLWAEPGAFQDGTIDEDSSFDADFYGPNAEELAGNWSFNVTGGSAPGTASGQFAAKR